MKSLYKLIMGMAVALPALAATGRPLAAQTTNQTAAHKRGQQAHAAPLRVFVRDRSSLQAPEGCCLAIPAGKTLTRSLEVVNHDPTGTRLQVRVLPALVLKPRARRPLPAIVRPVTVSTDSHVLLTLDIPVPQVTENTLLLLALSVRKGGEERYRETLPFVIVPPGPKGTQVQYEGRDDKTQGNWLDVYGQQGFLLPISLGTSGFQIASVVIRRGTGMEPAPDSPFDERLEEQAQYINLTGSPLRGNVDDPRVPVEGPGSTDRAPLAFAPKIGLPLLMRVDTSDGQPHRLSLYLLDYLRKGVARQIEMLDLQGHLLDRRRAVNYGEGAYLRYRFTGNLIIRIKALGDYLPALSGIFVDPDSGAGLLWH